MSGSVVVGVSLGGEACFKEDEAMGSKVEVYRQNAGRSKNCGQTFRNMCTIN